MKKEGGTSITTL